MRTMIEKLEGKRWKYKLSLFFLLQVDSNITYLPMMTNDVINLPR